MQTAQIAWTPPQVLYIPPPPRVVEPPVKAVARSSSAAAVVVLRAVFQPPRFMAPMHVPEKISLVGEPPVATEMGKALGGFGSSLFGPETKLGEVGRPVEAAAVPAQKPKQTTLRQSSGVQLAMLIHEVKPPYPPLAKAARISGVVRLAAVIARDGTIRNLQLLSGPPMLVKAALDAVQQWRYKPTLLSGEPVEVITEIDVNFTLTN
jgi:periplasmic protein TonB